MVSRAFSEKTKEKSERRHLSEVNKIAEIMARLEVKAEIELFSETSSMCRPPPSPKKVSVMNESPFASNKRDDKRQKTKCGSRKSRL